MGGDETSSNQGLEEIIEESNRQPRGNLTEVINEYYEALEQLGFMRINLYLMDLNELSSLLTNRRIGVANECYMIGLLSRTALVKDIPKTSKEMYPQMFPKEKAYKMPEFLKEKYYKENGGVTGWKKNLE